jgi:hypothetical protein
MLSFISEELVWAIRREREEAARTARPHTATRPEPERTRERESRPVRWVARACAAVPGAAGRQTGR